MGLENTTKINQKTIAERTGFSPSTVNRWSNEQRASIEELLIEHDSMKSERDELKLERDKLKLDYKEAFDFCNRLESTRVCLKSEIKELKSDYNELQLNFEKLELLTDECQDKEIELIFENEELKSFKDLYEGKNLITKALGNGITSTLIALAVATFTFFALWELMADFLGPLKSFISSAAMSVCLLHFTIRKNETSRRICIAIVFIVAGLFAGTTYAALIEEMKNGWTICVAIFFWLLPPVIEWRITEELK